MKGQMPKMGLRVRAEAVVLGAVLVGALALGGCSIGPFGAPPSASTILKRAAAIQITSEDFTEVFSDSEGRQIGLGSYEIKHTANPNRTDITFDFTSSAGHEVGEIINDAATNTSYEKLSEPASSATGKWFKTNEFGFKALQLASDIGPYLDFKDDTDAKLVGADTVNGAAVWHLRRDPAGGDMGSATEDLYIAQSDFKPVKIVVKETGANAPTTTIVFKAINDSGISIALPPADQITSA